MTAISTLLGRTFNLVPALETGNFNCKGCAAEDDKGLCKELAECVIWPPKGSRGLPMIWIERNAA
jgi:hypothetical protein